MSMINKTMENDYKIIQMKRVENARILGDWYRNISANYDSYVYNPLYGYKPTPIEVKIYPSIVLGDENIA